MRSIMTGSASNAVSNMITRRVRVNRRRAPWEALDAVNCVQDFGCVVADIPKRMLIAENMPRGEGEEVEVLFFEPNCHGLSAGTANESLGKKFDLRGLKPADPYSLLAVKEVDPTFADHILLCTRWLDAEGFWCTMVFQKNPTGKEECVR